METVSRDGRTLYFHSDTSLMAAPVTMAPELSAGEPRPVVELGDSQVLDVGQDGRFLAVQGPEPRVTHLEIVFNWFEQLKRLVPTDN